MPRVGRAPGASAAASGPTAQTRTSPAAASRARPVLDPQPLAVRPAVAQDVPHPLETRAIHGFLRVQSDDPDDPAHTLAPSLVRQSFRGARSRSAGTAAGAVLPVLGA